MARSARSVVVAVLLLLAAASAQSVDELKKCVAFVFGQLHVKAADGTLALGPNGQPLVLEMPLGTAFFVFYPDPRGGKDYVFDTWSQPSMFSKTSTAHTSKA